MNEWIATAVMIRARWARVRSKIDARVIDAEVGVSVHTRIDTKIDRRAIHAAIACRILRPSIDARVINQQRQMRAIAGSQREQKKRGENEP